MLQGDIENSKRVRPKKGTIKKSAKNGSDDEEYDFKPTKAKAAAKPRAAPKPKPPAEDTAQQTKLDAFVKPRPSTAVKRAV